MGDRILVVDDEPGVLSLLISILEGQGCACTPATSAEEALRLLGQGEFALMLSDVHMPGMSGLDLLEETRRRSPEVGVILVTAEDDAALARRALDGGAYGYIIKPFKVNEVLINISNALRRKRLEIENKIHQKRAEEALLQRSASLHQALGRLEQADDELRASQEEIIRRLSTAVEFRHGETAHHIQRMSRYCVLIARRLGREGRYCEMLRLASSMHDVGKIGIPDAILNKPGKLTSEEFDRMKEHTRIGHRLLSDSSSPLLRMGSVIALTHHERWDGSGYPDGLAGERIPLEGRITAVADVFDAMTSRRVYKPAYPMEETLDIMRKERGSHFDSKVLDLFLESVDEVNGIRGEYEAPS
jgi:putative two-component system response regulator